MGSVVKKIAPIALPIAGIYFAPALGMTAAMGGALGGAIGGVAAGGGLKGALLGGLTGFAGGKLASGFGLAGMGGGSGALQAGGARAGLMGMHGTGTATNAMLAAGTAPGQLAAKAATFASSDNVVSAMGTKAFSGGGYTSVGTPLEKTKSGLFSKLFGSKQQSTVSQHGGLTDAGFGGFNKEKVEELVGAGFSAYEGDIRQGQIDALQENLGQYRSEYSDYYASEAKKHEEKLARGELPDTYKSALEREKDRLTRLMIAQGHNPAEAGRGAEEVVRGTMDLEQQFINQERQYWRAVSGGADTMTARIAALQQEQAQQLRPREAGLGELGTSLAGTILGNKPNTSNTPSINVNLGTIT
tara:strand:+ start:657 stop:1730 length:1074 start_codon:yes stop_codon:yes gene_type:complete